MLTQTLIRGSVVSGHRPVGHAYVRLLDATGEFTAEVVSSADGEFRFYARPGTWTVRVLTPRGNGEACVKAGAGQPTDVTVSVGL